MNKKILFTIILIAILSISIAIITSLSQKQKKQSTVVAGLTPGQGQYFQKELASAFQQQSYIDKGKKLSRIGNFDGAIENYKKALSVSKMGGEKVVAQICLTNVYEKKHDYKTALEWMVLVRDHVNSWAKKPYEERVKYLEYAVQGEYDLAVNHAQKAIDEYMTVHGDMPVEKQEYTDRLNDLVAAKDYILSLRKK